MKNKEHNYIRNTILHQTNLTYTIMAVIILAIGVNLISNAISSIFNNDIYYSIITGCVIVVCFIMWVLYEGYKSVKSKFSITGNIFLNDNNEIFNIDRYSFNNKIKSYIDAICAENPAIKKQWHGVKLFTREINELKTHSTAEIIANEAIEYLILSKLSVHLRDYYNNIENINKYIKTVSRSDIPAFLLENRFVETFSKPMKDRSAFTPIEKPDLDELSISEGKIILAFGPNGEIYETFEFTIPSESTISKSKNGFTINSSRFSLEVSAKITRFN